MRHETQQVAAIHVYDAEPTAGAQARAPRAFGGKSIFLIVSAAFLVNAAIVLVALPKLSSPLMLTYSMNFGDLYDLIAKNLDEGKGYRVDSTMGKTMLREPGYPLLLAGVFKLGGYGIEQARAACVLLAFGAALMLLRLTLKITGDAASALAASLLFLLYPGILVAEARAGVEIPSIFTVMLFVLVLYSAVKKGSLWWYWAAGLLLGLAVLVRSEFLLFPLVLLVYLIFTSKGARERVKVAQRIAALGLGTVIVMSPWILRNYTLAHKFVPSATVAGVAAQEGLYTCEDATPGEPFYMAQTKAGFQRDEIARQLGKPFVGPYYQLFYTPQDEIAFNQALLNGVSAEYRSDPEILARCAAKNLFFNFWFLGKTRGATLLNVVMQVPLLALALGGVVLLWKRGLLRQASIVLLYTLYIPAVQAPIIAHARHSVLIIPFLAILAAVSLVSAWRALRMHNSASPLQQSGAA